MNKHRDSKERHVSSGLSLPNEMFDEIDKYILACGTGESRSECIRNLLKSVIDEWKKDQQIKESIESANKDTYRSPLGTAMSSLSVHVVSSSKDDTNSNINDKGVRKLKPESKMLEQMFLTPFDEIVKENLDDPKYMREIMVLLKKRYDFVSNIVAGFDNTPKTVKKMQELEEALAKNRERHPEIEGNNQINE
jgi:Arc/MetJ-type ribon-helix-helix transcriptional regulator